MAFRDASTELAQGRWQGRKDSNLGPSVLETDALTRLSYAPVRLEARRARGPAESNSSRRPKALFRAPLASCDAGNGPGRSARPHRGGRARRSRTPLPGAQTLPGRRVADDLPR